MKKLFVSLVVSIGLLLAFPVSSLAISNPSVTDVSGVVTNNSNGNPISGAKVTTVCDNTSLSDTTDSTGTYLVQYSATDCPNGAKATVIAVDGNLGGTNSGTINALTAKLNVGIINVSVPEFGLITGAAGLLVAGGAFAIIRQRHLEKH